MLGDKNATGSTLIFHHISKNCDGGIKSLENGAVITRKMHDRMNYIEHRDKNLYCQIQNYFQCYKALTDEDTKKLFRKLAYQDVTMKYFKLKKKYKKKKQRKHKKRRYKTYGKKH
jgi:hypothetical protein